MEGPPNTTPVEIRDNDSGSPAGNPLDDSQFFVRQHYYDFLSRLPDPSGFNSWVGQIDQCGSDQTCRRNKRIDVSNAFFYEKEYQQTGSYVYRLYRAAFGNNQRFRIRFLTPTIQAKKRSYLHTRSSRPTARGWSVAQTWRNHNWTSLMHSY
jgi:hypothetical protein